MPSTKPRPTARQFAAASQLDRAMARYERFHAKATRMELAAAKARKRAALALGCVLFLRAPLAAQALKGTR